MELVQVLKQVGLFQGLSEPQLERIGEISAKEIYKKGETVCKQGDPGEQMYIISEGEVEIVVRDSKGHTYSALYLGMGQIVGEMSLIDQGTRSASVIAAEDQTTVYAIPSQSFSLLCQEDTGIGYLMMRNIAQDLSFKLRHRDFDPADT